MLRAFKESINWSNPAGLHDIDIQRTWSPQGYLKGILIYFLIPKGHVFYLSLMDCSCTSVILYDIYGNSDNLVYGERDRIIL